VSAARVAAAILLFAVGCTAQAASEASSTSAALPSDLPCDVRAVLEANCQRCHGAPPKYGAPMPLVTWSDTQAAAASDPSKKVWQRIGARIHDATAPMPQGGTLSPADMGTLDSWIAQGAPQGSTTCDGSDGGGGAPAPTDVGPQALPCPASEQTTFRAHAAAAPDAAFAIPEDAGNLQQCFTYKAPWGAGAQATAFAPIIDDARVVHHWILFETATPQVDGGVGRCNMPLDAGFLQGWAPGGTNRVFPKDVGLALPGQERWLILQVHYWNAAHYKDARDRSGVAMCTTATPREHTAVMSTLGSAAINLPPRSTGVTATGMCTPDTKEPLHVLAAGPHMHRLGKAFKTEILRGGLETDKVMLVEVPKWNFDLQEAYRSEQIIQPGDKLRTTCTYDNPSDKRVTFGETTEDEMCFDFVAVWPAPGLATAAGRAARRCIDP
jgi:hypothetical protein